MLILIASKIQCTFNAQLVLMGDAETLGAGVKVLKIEWLLVYKNVIHPVQIPSWQREFN